VTCDVFGKNCPDVPWRLALFNDVNHTGRWKSDNISKFSSIWEWMKSVIINWIFFIDMDGCFCFF
jgi:hypothetical protein